MPRTLRQLAVALATMLAFGYVVAASSRDDGEFKPIFNGQDLTGWRVYKGKPDNWGVEDGVLFTRGTDRGWLVTDARLYRWCSAEWFERTAPPVHSRKVARFKTDSVNVHDDFDPFSPAYQADPYSVLGALSRDTPVFYAPRLDYYAVTRYDDVEAIFTRKTIGCSAKGNNNTAQSAIVHVHRTLPGNPP